MRPGRELDALIAERVLGWKWLMTKYDTSDRYLRWLVWPEKQPSPGWGEWDGRDCVQNDLQSVPHFSTSISDAWSIVEKLRREFSPIIAEEGVRQADGTHRWGVDFIRRDLSGEDVTVTLEAGDTVPHAICLAALNAVRAEVHDAR